MKLNGAGAKWFGDEKADARVKDLVGKLAKLTPIEADAVGAAIRQFWREPSIDHATDEWWLPNGGRGTPDARGARR